MKLQTKETRQCQECGESFNTSYPLRSCYKCRSRRHEFKCVDCGEPVSKKSAKRCKSCLKGSGKRTVCTVPGCDNAEISKGLCDPHYSRQRRWGDVRADLPLKTYSKLPSRCQVNGCERAPKSKGLCNLHYTRLQIHGDVKADKPGKIMKYSNDAECAAEGCVEPPYRHLRCKTHWWSWKQYGMDRAAACEVCERKDNIVWDHDHGTGKFRGWLCNRCNLVLGSVEDNTSLMRALIDYLERPDERTRHDLAGSSSHRDGILG